MTLRDFVSPIYAMPLIVGHGPVQLRQKGLQETHFNIRTQAKSTRLEEDVLCKLKGQKMGVVILRSDQVSFKIRGINRLNPQTLFPSLSSLPALPCSLPSEPEVQLPPWGQESGVLGAHLSRLSADHLGA